MKLRRANVDELEMLNEMAFESESIWGEDQAYMEAFSKSYGLTEHMIKNDYVYIMESEKNKFGFFAIVDEMDHFEMELFYIDKSLIGKGYGRILWKKMINKCREKEIESIQFVGSSDVSKFYEKLGATELEKIKSVLKVGRIVSRLEYKIE